MKLSDKLDYKLNTVEERLALVKKIVSDADEFLVDYYDNHYNPHLNHNSFLSENTRVSKDLESLASYILYAKDSSNNKEIITDYRQKRNNNREAAIDNFMKIRDITRKETNRSIIKYPKIKVKSKDREQYKELAETEKTIKQLTKIIETGKDNVENSLSSSYIKKLKWIRTDIQKDEIAIKNELKGYIRFQNIAKSEPDYNALSYIQFDSIEVLRVLVEDYSDLKEHSYEDTFGYLKLIMFVFEELVDATNFEGYLKDVFLWKIEGISYDEMISRLKEKYNMKMTKPRLSKITRETIPSMIAETYKQLKEDWVYTFVMRGKYKTCNSCRKNYLATTKYFSLNRRTKSGLRPICKKCRKDKYQKSVVAKTE